MTGETAHRSTAATKEVNGPGIIWHIPRPTRNEETVPEQIEQPTFTPRPVLSFVRRSGRLGRAAATRVGQLRRHVSAGHQRRRGVAGRARRLHARPRHHRRDLGQRQSADRRNRHRTRREHRRRRGRAPRRQLPRAGGVRPRRRAHAAGSPASSGSATFASRR